MAKINTLTVEGTKKDGYTVTAMTDDGTLLDIKEGFEFATVEENNRLVGELTAANESLADLHADHATAGGELERLRVEIGQLRQELAAKPIETRAPLLHTEHQDIPVARTVDKLAPLGALAAAPPIDEPYIPALIDPDAPARPPGPQEMSKVHGEYQGTQGPVGADGYTTDEGKTEA